MKISWGLTPETIPFSLWQTWIWVFLRGLSPLARYKLRPWTQWCSMSHCSFSRGTINTILTYLLIYVLTFPFTSDVEHDADSSLKGRWKKCSRSPIFDVVSLWRWVLASLYNNWQQVKRGVLSIQYNVRKLSNVGLNNFWLEPGLLWNSYHYKYLLHLLNIFSL